MKYISHYDQNTAIRHGTYPTAQDIAARAALLKEKGLTVCGEMLQPNKGYVPIFEGPALRKEDQNLLCVAPLDEPEPPARPSEPKDPLAALIQEYQAEFLRVKGHGIDVKQQGTQILINGEVIPTRMVERFLATLKAS